MNLRNPTGRNTRRAEWFALLDKACEMNNETLGQHTRAEDARFAHAARCVLKYRSENWAAPVPPVCTARWDEKAWVRHVFGGYGK